MLGSEPLDCVDRAEHLSEIGAGRGEVERDVLALTDQPVRAVRQPVSIDLEPMAEPRLDDPVPGLHLVDQTVHVGDVIVVDTIEVLSDDRAEHQTAETWRRVDRQDHVSERDPSCWLNRTTVEDLQFGQEHHT